MNQNDMDIVSSWPTPCCRSASKDLREQLGPDLTFFGSFFTSPDMKFDMEWNEQQKTEGIQKVDISHRIKMQFLLLMFAWFCILGCVGRMGNIVNTNRIWIYIMVSCMCQIGMGQNGQTNWSPKNGWLKVPNMTRLLWVHWCPNSERIIHFLLSKSSRQP